MKLKESCNAILKTNTGEEKAGWQTEDTERQGCEGGKWVRC